MKLSKNVVRIVALVAISLFPLASCSAPAEAVSNVAASAAPKQIYIDSIDRYISVNKGWSKDQYTIIFEEKSGNMVYFYVKFKLPGQSNAPTLGNDGKSFNIILNADTGDVIKTVTPQ